MRRTYSAGTGDGGGVAVVGVDADEILSVGGLDVADGHLAGVTVLLAVAA